MFAKRESLSHWAYSSRLCRLEQPAGRVRPPNRTPLFRRPVCSVAASCWRREGIVLPAVLTFNAVMAAESVERFAA